MEFNKIIHFAPSVSSQCKYTGAEQQNAQENCAITLMCNLYKPKDDCHVHLLEK